MRITIEKIKRIETQDCERIGEVVYKIIGTDENDAKVTISHKGDNSLYSIGDQLELSDKIKQTKLDRKK